MFIPNGLRYGVFYFFYNCSGPGYGIVYEILDYFYIFFYGISEIFSSEVSICICYYDFYWFYAIYCSVIFYIDN